MVRSSPSHLSPLHPLLTLCTHCLYTCGCTHPLQINIPVEQTTAGPNGALAGKKPAPTASAEGAAASGLRNRRPVAAARAGQNTGRGMGGSTAGILRFYTDDSPGLKIGPTTVLVSCLMFVGFVVLLHVWGKFRG
uniref:Protein transport protein Sec61 subunit beta n=1 Tax=Hyaloperonospora arabidopsidis (strain Emoy2) TaxID=559515 RepID=M4BXI3_HYAAE